MLPGARSLRAAGLLRPPGLSPLTGAARRARSCGPGQRPGGRGAALPAGPDLRHFLRANAAAAAGPPEPPPEPGSAPGAPKGLWVCGSAGLRGRSWWGRLWPRCRANGSRKAGADSAAPQPEHSGVNGLFGRFWGSEGVVTLEGVSSLAAKPCVLSQQGAGCSGSRRGCGGPCGALLPWMVFVALSAVSQ